MTPLRAIRVLLFCTLVAAVASAQQFVFRSFRQAEGLKNLSINCIARDRDGFLWVGTENGLYRLLGSSFERYGLEDGLAGVDIRQILADPSGTLWVGTEENFYRLDGTRFVPVGSRPISATQPRAVLREDDTHLLVIDNGKLYRMEHAPDGRMQSYTPVLPKSILAAHPDLEQIISVSLVRAGVGEDNLWLATDRALYSLSTRSSDDGVRVIRTISDWSRAKGLPPDQWQGVARDRTGNIWAAGLKHVSVLRPGSGRFVDRDVPGAEHQNIFGYAPLVEDPQGRMIIPAGAGLARWDGAKWQFIGKANGLSRISTVSGIVFNSEGDLFLGCRGDGVYEWVGYSDWEGWGNEQRLPAVSTWSLLLDGNNRVLLGTESGPAWIDGNSGESGALPLRARWSRGRVASLGRNSDGSFWAATYSGAFLRLNDKTGEVETLAHLPGSVLAGFQGPAGQLFLFSRQGVFLRDSAESHASLRPITDPGKRNAHPSILGSIESGCIAPDGAAWFLGSGSVSRFKNSQWSDPAIIGFGKLNGSLLGLACARDGSLWVTGDQTGTWHLQPEGSGLKAARLPLPPELQSLSGLTLLEDRRGWIWLGTDVGFLVWNGKNWRHITEETGLIWNDTNQGVLAEASDGTLWIGTSGGVSHLLHPERVFDPVPITVSLTGIRHGSDNMLGMKHITVKESGPPLHFQISSPSMRNRSELVLQLRLAGLRSDWEPTKDGNAVFSSLRAGSYTFEAMACNPGFDACSAPIAIGIKVLPPWYGTLWFYTLSFLALAVLGWYLIQLYAHHLRQKSRELEQLVGERTRELERSRELLRVQASHDGLTGLLNRTAVLGALAEEMERARREQKSLVIALVDLDHFKRVNDEWGHLAGDEALRIFAAAVNFSVRLYDRCGRYGGEEFLIVLPDIPVDAIDDRLGSLHSAITNLSVQSGESSFRVTCSMGAVIAFPSSSFMNSEPLLAVADGALYEAKASGRNRFVVKYFQQNQPRDAEREVSNVGRL